MTILVHEWDFETASRFLQSLAKQAAWRAHRNLKAAGIEMRVFNGPWGTVEVQLRLTDKGVVK